MSLVQNKQFIELTKFMHMSEFSTFISLLEEDVRLENKKRFNVPFAMEQKECNALVEAFSLIDLSELYFEKNLNFNTSKTRKSSEGSNYSEGAYGSVEGKKDVEKQCYSPLMVSSPRMA